MLDRSILTVVGKDRVGIIAGVCTYLAGQGVNVLSITQSIVDGFFNMMMIVDTSGSWVHYQTLVDDLEGLGKEMGVIIKLQREEIFQAMQRI